MVDCHTTQFTTDEQLRTVFSAHGVLRDLYMPRNKITNQGKGFAFLEYTTSQEADAYVCHAFVCEILGIVNLIARLNSSIVCMNYVSAAS